MTIGFARRFATYKRATLLFSDIDRLREIITNADRPVQFIFSGKAHPADHPAKEYIKLVASKLKDPKFDGKIIFLEDYEIRVAEQMIAGVDIWLNTPQRPKEASGTSGMKVVPNGGLNLSILDGWWAEGYEPDVGWAIGAGENHDENSDGVEANAVYDLLETQVAPLFYERDQRDCPMRWVQMMKASMKQLAARFSSDRMVMEYTDRFYIPTAERFLENVKRPQSEAQQIVDWKNRVRGSWHEVGVVEVQAPSEASSKIGEPFTSPREGAARAAHAGRRRRAALLRSARRAGRAARLRERVDAARGVGGRRARLPDGRALSEEWALWLHGPRRSEARGVLIPNELTVIRWA